MSNRQFFKRRSFIFLLIGLLLGSIPSALFVAAQSGTPTTFTISSGQSPGAVEWTVYTDGGYYYAKNRFGVLLSSSGSTNASYVLNTVRGMLTASRTWKETIKVKGNITLNAPILTDTQTIWDLQEAYFVLASGSNCHMIANNGVFAFTVGDKMAIEILGGTFNGNKAGQTIEAEIIHIAGNSGTNLIIRGLLIRAANGYGMRLESMGSPFLEDITIEGASKGGFDFSAVYDGTFIRLNPTSTSDYYGVYLRDHFCVSNHFAYCYFGGSTTNVYAVGISNTFFESCTNNDAYSNGYEFVDDGANYCFGNLISGGRAAVNSWAGAVISSNVKFGGNSQNNTVVGVMMDELTTGTASYRSDYGVWEVGSANRTFVTGCTINSPNITALNLTGVGSSSTNNFINGTLVP